MAKYTCYVVLKGRKPGVYKTWNECKIQVDKFPNADYHGCSSLEEAYEEFNKHFKAKNPVIEAKFISNVLETPKMVIDKVINDVIEGNQISYPMMTRIIENENAGAWKREDSVF